MMRVFVKRELFLQFDTYFSLEYPGNSARIMSLLDLVRGIFLHMSNEHVCVMTLAKYLSHSVNSKVDTLAKQHIILDDILYLYWF